MTAGHVQVPALGFCKAHLPEMSRGAERFRIANCGLRIWGNGDCEIQISKLSMDKVELERRTKSFALRVIRFVAALPKNKVTDVLGYQPVISDFAIRNPKF
jgi:hypothetical protein